MNPRTLQVLATAALVASLGWSLVGRKPSPVAPRAAAAAVPTAPPAIKVRSSAKLRLPGWNGPADKGLRAILKAMVEEKINPARHQLYLPLRHESSQKPGYR